MAINDFTKLSIPLKCKYIFQNVQFLICLNGIVGNYLTFRVFKRTRFTNISFPIYAKIMAITDSLVLLLTINTWTSFMFGLDMTLTSPILCSLSAYFVVTFSGISLWLLTLAALDRLLSISYPTYHRHLIKTLNFRLILILLIFSCNFLIYLPMPLNYTLWLSYSNSSLVICQPRNIQSAFLINWLILGNVTMVTVVNNVLAGMLFVSLLRSRRKLMIYTSDRVRRDRKFSLNSIALNVACFVCKMPLIIYYNALPSVLNADVFQMGLTILETIFTLDNAAPFLVNMSVNSIFKKKFWAMVYNSFGKKCKRQRAK
jgi:hypothetical protein